ncbi:MAG: 3-isopropylmalate dehydratase small subunit [bacterium]
MEKIEGRCWVFGDNIDTDVIFPTQYLSLPDIQKACKYAFEPIRPEFSKEVREGNIIVAGKNFGCGSSREQAPAVLKESGIKVIIARSFARIFYRNAINLGIPVIECDTIQDVIKEGDTLEVNITDGEIVHKKTGILFKATKIPSFMIEIFNCGGLVEYMKQRNK